MCIIPPEHPKFYTPQIKMSELKPFTKLSLGENFLGICSNHGNSWNYSQIVMRNVAN